MGGADDDQERPLLARELIERGAGRVAGDRLGLGVKGGEPVAHRGERLLGLQAKRRLELGLAHQLARPRQHRGDQRHGGGERPGVERFGQQLAERERVVAAVCPGSR